MLYHWNNPESLLHHVEMLPGRKAPEAVLYAPDGADAAKLQTLNEKLQARGYLTTADDVEGRPALRIQKFGSREELFTALGQLGAVSGTPVTQFTPLDKAAHKTAKDKINENMMTGAGWLFLVGDALMVLSGALRKDWAEASTGVIWGSTGAVLAGFGKKDTDTQMSVLYRRLGQHLKKEGIELPRDEQQLLAALKRKDGLLQHTAEFLTDNAADFHHAMQAVGGTTLIKAGWNQRKENPLKMAAGVSVTFGQAMGLMPEKEKPVTARPAAYGTSQAPLYSANTPSDEDDKSKTFAAAPLPAEPDHRGPVKRVVDWFNEKPLRYSGIFPALNNVFNVIGALKWEMPQVEAKNKQLPGLIHNLEEQLKRFPEMINGKTGEELQKALSARDALKTQLETERHRMEDFRKSVIRTGFTQPANGSVKGIHAWHVNVTTAACYVVANIMYSLCSKNGSADLEKLGHADDIYAAVANIALHQPPEFRQPFIERVSTFLGEQKNLHATADQIAQKVHTKAKALEHSPWLTRMKLQAANENTQDASKGIA
jgi:hypothetical protein